jgi:flagellar hook assembly protein FlgD
MHRITKEVSIFDIDFILHQNYPNPFNPVTTIKFDLPKEGIVKFKIYDILGKEVYSLNEIRQAGYHNITFNGSNLSSGIYFYKIEYSNLVQTKRLVLIK